jgi:type III restriction enzyme
LGAGAIEESRMEDYVVSGLIDFDDVSYDDQADLLYDLAAQTVKHFLGYLSPEETAKVLRCHQKEIARFIHVQMQDHYWESASHYETRVTKGFSELKPSAYTASAADPILDYRNSPSDKSNMSKYLFGGFSFCLYPVEKFQSDPERRLAVILEREEKKWFKPRKGQFQIFYKWAAEHREYQPDFVAEGPDCIYMLEPKAANQMQDEEVIAKRDVAVKWCALARDYAASIGEKPWQYALIPHDAIADNMTIEGLVKRYRVDAASIGPAT